MTLVFENLPRDPPSKLNPFKVAKQILDALNYLHQTVNCAHGLLTTDSIVWSNEDIKLIDWPINLLTGGGSAIGSLTILPANISFTAPEQVREPHKQATYQSDIWSAGLILLKLIKPDCRLPDNPFRLAFCDSSVQVIEQIEGGVDDSNVPDPARWNQFFRLALHPDPGLRGSLNDLYPVLGLDYFPRTLSDPFKPILVDFFETQQSLISNLNIAEVYYLWRLSLGRNFESEQKQDDYPPIFKIPYLIVTEKQINLATESKFKDHIIIDTRPKLIPLDKFKLDIGNLDQRILYPLILTDEELLIGQDRRLESITESNTTFKECNNNRKQNDSFTFADLDYLSTRSSIQTQLDESSKALPLVIKEADFAYQCERLVLFKRLISGCPYLKPQLRREASIDIPPYYRAQTWAILLDVSRSKSERLYESIDKTTPIATDRQISVDIPRCHQYNELMASPQGHQKLARILKAWLNYNSEEYVYWQGLDSLAAPFLLLNFDNEAMAFACFDAFVNKYLRGFFRKDNQLIVQQYLNMFSELLSYHDASLALHLERLGFLPNLYAIPWFLTMFTHVLPLHKVLHVWDCLLLGDEKFPLCIGLAILNQLRPELMEFNFNDCIVAFSDLPEIDIERCIREASHFYNSTPDKLINFADIRDSQDSW